MQATLKCPDGASIDIDVDEESQALRLTADAGGQRVSVKLPPKSAAALRSILAMMEHVGGR